MTRNRDPLKRSGIEVGVFPSTDPLCDLELWRSTQSASTASSLWGVTRYPPSTTPSYTVTVPIPVTTRYQYFKARSQKLGFSPSTFTPIVRAKPIMLSQWPSSPNVPTNNVGAVELPVPIFMNAAETVEVGAPSQITPTTFLTKTLRVPFTEFQIDRPTTSGYILLDSLFVSTTGLAGTKLFRAPCILPSGVTITGLKTRAYRSGTSTGANRSGVTLGLYRGSSVAGQTLIAATSQTSSGWATSTDNASQLVGDEHYTMTLTLATTVTGGGTNTHFNYCDVVYRMPAYSRGY